MTLSTKWTGKGCMGPAVRRMACCSTVKPGRPRNRREQDDSTGWARATAHLTRAPGTSSAMARARARLAVRLPSLAGTGHKPARAVNERGHSRGGNLDCFLVGVLQVLGDTAGVSLVGVWRAVAQRHVPWQRKCRWSLRVVRRGLQGHVAKLAQAAMVWGSHDDMIQHFDFEKLAGAN